MSKVYEIVTDALIQELENGTAPWQTYTKNNRPVNGKSLKSYNGVNHWVLSSIGRSKGYLSNSWLTYKQALELGGNVKKGEKSAPVLFAMSDKDKLTGEKTFCIRFYQVFNSQQCENIKHELPSDSEPINAIEAADSIVNNMPQRPVIKHNPFGIAYYRMIDDSINMPDSVTCSSEEYYSVLFHELAHSTGSKSRLNRDSLNKIQGYGSHEYSKEELVAEMTSAILCGQAGILPKTLDNSAAYCRSWLKVLKNDRSMLVQASSQAFKAADFILGVK